MGRADAVTGGFHLAQVNIALFRTPADHPDNAAFFEAIDGVNALADQADGFVWRLVGDGGADATALRPFDNAEIIINMSVWTGLAELGAFVYRSGHVAVMRRRRDWFADMETYMALWWVPAGTIPTVQDARERLDLLARLGPTAEAFTFRQPFPAPDAASIAPVLDTCA